MRRRRVLALIALGIVVFVLISGLLARAFSADGAERSAVTSLVQAEARGNAGTAADHLERCAANPGCRARLAAITAAIKRPGDVSVLQLETSTSFSLGGTVGTARIAFRVGDSLPIVQCVRVRRAGSVFSGLRVELLAITPPMKGDASCPARF